jgi:hypothetical protein
MPQGKGTYGSKIGRPPARKTTGGGQPVRKAKAPVRVKRTTAKRTSRK